MTKTIVFSGFGGQGILTLGQIASLMAMHKGYNVTWLPSYGAEMRGGTANCSVVISDEPIGSPLLYRTDILCAFNKPSILKFAPRVEDDGTVIVNSSIVDFNDAKPDQTVIKMDASNIASEMGNLRVTNMVMLGAFMKALPLFTMEDAEKAIREKLGKKYEHLTELNLQAVKKGLE